jgi:hypothetical protein
MRPKSADHNKTAVAVVTAVEAAADTVEIVAVAAVDANAAVAVAVAVIAEAADATTKAVGKTSSHQISKKAHHSGGPFL